ncbi:hypothetical protein PGTUg99_026448 [Puccinia graminis f. sp. tritici]|nr:hypothetical protein PGTUg99_026448 [Puccinia graminis f. sp. tritici]
MNLPKYTSKLLSINFVTLICLIKISLQVFIPHESSSGVEDVSESVGQVNEVTSNPRFVSSDTNCAICIEELQRDKDNIQIGTLEGCGHSFHRTCADPWLKSKGTCPTCRKTYYEGYSYKDDPKIYQVNVQASQSIVQPVLDRVRVLLDNIDLEGLRDLFQTNYNPERHDIQ